MPVFVSLVAAAWPTAHQAAGQTPLRRPDVIFVESQTAVVEAMLALAKVTKNDVVYDLGCGNGKIVIAAARQYRARGVGIDIDPARIIEANAAAKAASCAFFQNAQCSSHFMGILAGSSGRPASFTRSFQ